MRGIRRLAAASFGYCAAIFASHYLLPHGQTVTVLALPVIIALSALLLKDRQRRTVLIFAAFAAVGILHYDINYDITVNTCSRFDGEETTISARLTEYPDVRDNCTLLYVKITDDEHPRLGAVLFDYSNTTHKLCPGDEIRAKVKLSGAHERYGKATDSNISRGVYLSGSIIDGVEKTGQTKSLLLNFPTELGRALHEKIGEIFPEDTAPFMKALLAGYKGDYYKNDKLYSAMNTVGLSHVVAVSGMHVAFLVGVLQSIMGRNRRSSVLCIGLVWLFVCMVGSPLSAVRAGIMISMLMLAPMVNRVNDKLTTLPFALALSLAANPFSAGSVALQLSFGSVAGMMLFSQPINEYINKKLLPLPLLIPLWDYVSATLASSLAVTVFTVPLLGFHFGTVMLLSPVSNILCLWAISALFTGGFVLCAVGLVLPTVAVFLANILSYLVRYIACVVEFMAKLPYAAAYTENPWITVWLVLTYLVFAAYFVLRRRKKLSALLPCVLCAAIFVGITVGTAVSVRADKGTVSVMNVGNGQCIAVTNRENVVVIDCGSHRITENAGSMLSSYLHAGGRSSVDYLFLTHLHKDHACGVVRLLNLMDVKTLILPDNAQDTNSDGMLESILETAEENGTRVVYITQDTAIVAGGISVSVYESSDIGKRNESGIMMTVSIGDYDMLVTGDVEKSVERSLVQLHDLSGTELLIAGHHGSKYSTSEELLSAASPQLAVISTGYNSYDHPTDEVLERLENSGADIMRTDEDGRIIIHVGD